MTDPVSTPCGHNFCKACLSQHINAAASAYYGSSVSCPTCRSQIQSSVAQLRVNTGLRDMIQHSLTGANNQSPPEPPLPPFNNAPCSIAMSHAPAPADKVLVHIAIEPVSGTDGVRQPLTAVIVLDASGSMGTSLPNPTGEKGVKLFTRLDLAKHVCTTTAHMMGDEDTLCIIRFSTAATVVLKPIRMTAAGKVLAEQAIKTIRADGGTNIWSAIQLMNKITTKPEFTGRNIVAALLTDGEVSAGTSPRQGEAVAYKAMVRPEKMSVFGFSYDIKSKFLGELAAVGNCIFTAIPDATMVGTAFVNWMATMLSTASLERTAVVAYADGTTSEHKTGLIQFGQPRDIVFMADSKPLHVKMDTMVASEEMLTLSPMANARFELLNRIQFCIGHAGATDYLGIYTKYSASSDPQVRELMRDIKPAGSDDEGQVSMATGGNGGYWQKWGEHYTRSYYTAVLQQVCFNFKDPGVKIYGGRLFQEISEAGDLTFCALPPPEATGGGDYATGTSGGYAAVPINMSSYHSAAGGGCWAPGTKVRMSDDTFKIIEDIKKGERIWTPNGGATVEYLVVLCRSSPFQLMCHYNKMVWITPWHPVLDDERRWIQPASRATPVDMLMPIVYNMVLDKGHIIDVDGVLSVTLGHGFKGHIIEHGFFGNKTSILNALSKQPGFAKGRPVFQNLKTHIDPITDQITGWYDDV